MDYRITRSEDYIQHHGILGQKWGVRRYQNSDGTWTAAGKRRYVKATKTLEKYGKKIVDEHMLQVMLMNSYAYETPQQRKTNDILYKDVVNNINKNLNIYKTAEDYIRSIGQIPISELESRAFIKTMYQDSPYHNND